MHAPWMFVLSASSSTHAVFRAMDGGGRESGCSRARPLGRSADHGMVVMYTQNYTLYIIGSEDAA